MSRTLKEQFLGFYNTPDLFNNIKTLKQFSYEKLQLDKINYSKLNIKENLPLGKRVEYFFEYYIKHTFRYNLVKKNIQVLKDKQTLGEIDFILYDKYENCFKHIELVYKYYLYDLSYKNELDRYIGPNRNDTLVKKLEKIEHKQFPLIYKSPTKKYLENIDIENLKQEVAYKANIYLPLLDLKAARKVCGFKDSIQGFYLSYEEFKRLSVFENYEFFLPHRYDWICSPSLSVKWYKYDEIKSLIEFYLNYKKSPLVWMKKKSKIRTFFITWW